MSKVELKDMWVVNSHFGKYRINAVVDEKGEVMTYRFVDTDDYDADEWYNARKNSHFFNSEGQCIDYINDRRRELSEAIPFIKECMEAYDYLDDDDEIIKKLKEADISFPDFVNNDCYLRKMYFKERDKNRLLTLLVCRNVLNINAETIPVDEVRGIDWNNDGKATIVTKSGSRIVTYSEAEYELVQAVFGSNISERIHKKNFNTSA